MTVGWHSCQWLEFLARLTQLAQLVTLGPETTGRPETTLEIRVRTLEFSGCRKDQSGIFDVSGADL
jgi:hypothetical protein